MKTIPTLDKRESIEVFGSFVPFDFLVKAINTEEESGIVAYVTLNVEVKECEGKKYSCRLQ